MVGVSALVMGGGTSRLLAQGNVASVPSAKDHAEDVFARQVTVQLDRVGLQAAVDAIAKNAGIRVQYEISTLRRVGERVSLHASKLPLGVALDRVLQGTNLQAVALDRDLVGIQPAGDNVQPTRGAVSGVVTDVKTKQPLRGASVALDDSLVVSHTDNAGKYRLTQVAAGAHRVTIRAVGYARQTKLVTVTDEQTATLDFALDASVNTLDQIVVTATGAQRYRELGHVVTQINADSLVREAPITTLSELLTARVPGLQVLGTNGGSVGGDVALRLRGSTTTSLDPQPIVIVDGIRYKNTSYLGNAGGEDQRPFGVEQRSPLNDLSVNDIETVEVVKGPSASTLYGPDAANGVIVITTKRGKPGPAQWHVYAYPDMSTLSVGSAGSQVDLPYYSGWGHVPNSTDIYQGQCTIFAQAAHQCVLDSIVVTPNAANNPEVSAIAKQRPQWHAGVSVSGGSATQSYFLSANRDSQTGQVRLSPAAAETLKNLLGATAIDNAFKTPNDQQQLDLRMNLSSAITPTFNVTLAGGYTQATQRAINTSVFWTTNQLSAPDPGYTYTAADSAAWLANQSSPYTFLSTSQMEVTRWTVAVNSTFQPRPWLSATAGVGTDLDNTADRALQPATTEGAVSSAYDYRRANTNRTARLGATASGHPGIMSFRTSLGVDYSYTNEDGLNGSAQNLAPGSKDLSTGQSAASRLWSERVQLGTYAEEVVGLRDRLFLTGSLRVDGSTTFGDAYAPKPFPKVGLSWVVSDEPFLRALHSHGLDELRLRYSFGAASRYPTSAMKFGQIFSSNALIEGIPQSEFYRATGANPDLRPERSREAEYGAEATIWSKIRVGLTWYNRRTIDELQTISGPTGMLLGWANVGNLSASGFESTIGVNVYQSQLASLDLNVSYANNKNKVLSLGAATGYRDLEGSYSVGYPLGASFGTRTVGYVDSAGGPDGFISQTSEVVSSPNEYLGTIYPPRNYTFTPTLSLFGSRIRISSLFDRQAGGVQNVTLGICRNGTLRCKDIFLASTPLFQQALMLGVNGGDNIQSSDFTRWRELSITGELPLSLREHLHLSRASVSAQVRNLAMWTPSKAPDPESVPGLGITPSGMVGNGLGASGVPQPRSWTIRFDIAP